MAEDLEPWTDRPPHLHRYRDRHGIERVYLRRPGAPRKAMRSPWGTRALQLEAEAALKEAIAPKPEPTAGTLAGAVREYRKSADYLTLTAATQLEYDRWLDRFESAFADVLLSDVDAAFVLALRDRLAQRTRDKEGRIRGGYRAANLALQILKNICKAPRIRGEISGDPFGLIEKVARPHSYGQANPRWLDDEFEAALERCIEDRKPGLARALALGRWGGFRRQTICKAPRSARIIVRGEDGAEERRLYWLTEKRLVLCDRREDLRLTALLDRTERMRPRFGGNVQPFTIAYNSWGEAWKPRALEHEINRLIVQLAKEGLCRPGLTLHGLRHARGVEIAAAGGSDAEIMAQLDHATPRQAAEYRKQAERLGLAESAQSKVDAKIVKLRARPAKVSQSENG